LLHTAKSCEHALLSFAWPSFSTTTQDGEKVQSCTEILFLFANYISQMGMYNMACVQVFVAQQQN
jgi:hypothetical protein